MNAGKRVDVAIAKSYRRIVFQICRHYASGIGQISAARIIARDPTVLVVIPVDLQRAKRPAPIAKDRARFPACFHQVQSAEKRFLRIGLRSNGDKKWESNGSQAEKWDHEFARKDRCM